MFGRATITLGIGPHSSFSCLSLDTCMTCLGSSQVSMSRDCVLTVSVRHSYNCLLWSPYGIGQTIIFSSCFFFLFYFLAPNLSGQRLDVYRTSTRGVALVRIQNAGLKCAARGSLQIQDAKKSPSGHHRTTLSGCIFATKACIDNRKKLLSSYISSTCPQYGELRPTIAAEIVSGAWGTRYFQGLPRLGSVTARHVVGQWA